MVDGTTGIKTAATIWATIFAVQILHYGEFFLASATQHGLAILLVFWPGCRHMICFFRMAFIAGIVIVAAMELYSNDVGQGMVMNTPGFIIYHIPFYRDLISFHRIFFRDCFGYFPNSR